MVRLGWLASIVLCVVPLVAPYAANAADAALSDSTSVAPVATSNLSSGTIHVLLRNGVTVEAERVRPSGTDVLKLMRPAGRDTFVYTNRVEKITDETGNDRTREVLRDWKEVRVGRGPNAPAPKAPPGERGPFVSVHMGESMPVGSVSNNLDSGPSAGASIFWRTNRNDSYGASVSFDRFRGNQDFLRTYGGYIDRVRYTSWSAGGLAQWLVLPDRLVTPLFHFGLRVGPVRSSLSGAIGSGSASSWALTEELGLGVRGAVSRRNRLDLLACYTDTNVRAQTATAGAAILSTKGHLRYIQLRVGLTRRFGG